MVWKVPRSPNSCSQERLDRYAKYQGPASYQSSVQRKIDQRCEEWVGLLQTIVQQSGINDPTTWGPLNNEVQAFIETYRRAARVRDILISKENIKRYIVEPMRIYTKLGTLNNHIHAKQNTLLSDALECLHRHDEGQPQISPIAAEYNIWRAYLTEKPGLNIPELAICRLAN